MDRLKPNIHHLLGETVISALYQHEIFTVKDFIFCNTQTLAKISLLVFKEILEIKKYLVDKYAAVSKNAYDTYQCLLQNSAIISSGVQSIDEFLEGGLFTGNIYEICGRAASGKTLLAYTFMKNLVLEMKQNCLLLDTRTSFGATKFSLLCKGYTKEDISNGLSKILIKSIQNKYDLVNSLQEISEKHENNFLLRMIVINSLPPLILTEHDTSENNLILCHLTNLMHYIASKFHVVFLVINLVTTWLEGDFTAQVGTTSTVCCGKFWYTVPNTRIKLEVEDSKVRLHIAKSSILPLGSIDIPSKDIFSYEE